MVTADRLILRAQAAHLRLMVDTCEIKRRATATTDADTGIVTYTYTTLYTGACRVKQRSTTGVVGGRPHDVGEAFERLLAVELQLPVTATGIQADDIVTYLTSLHDADLVGRIFVVSGLSHRTHGSAHRFPCLEVLS